MKINEYLRHAWMEVWHSPLVVWADLRKRECYNPARLWAIVTKHGCKRVFLFHEVLLNTSHDLLHKITKQRLPLFSNKLLQPGSSTDYRHVIHFPPSSKPRQSGLIKFTRPVYCWTLFSQTWDSKQGKGLSVEGITDKMSDSDRHLWNISCCCMLNVSNQRAQPPKWRW